jgi:hypothetical protein
MAICSAGKDNFFATLYSLNILNIMSKTSYTDFIISVSTWSSSSSLHGLGICLFCLHTASHHLFFGLPMSLFPKGLY